MIHESIYLPFRVVQVWGSQGEDESLLAPKQATMNKANENMFIEAITHQN